MKLVFFLEERSMKELLQIDGARRIAPYMNIAANTSHSFRVFTQGIVKLCGEGDRNG